jgi:hypothetical protein
MLVLMHGQRVDTSAVILVLQRFEYDFVPLK